MKWAIAQVYRIDNPAGEMRGTRWEEIDLEAAVRTIPPERMKHKREHRVPLSGRAREILAEARRKVSALSMTMT